MYDPMTLVFSFPPYPRGGIALGGQSKPWTLGRWLYGLKNWIGFDVWHIDPERPSEGQRTDDSCGWFDRRPGPFADAVAYLLRDKETLHEIARAMSTRMPVTSPYGHTYSRMPLGETLAICTLVANELELHRWWNGQGGNDGAASSWLKRTFTSRRDVGHVVCSLALNPLDNLSAISEPDALVRIIAAALHRHLRPWWKHPRWHIHHWKVNFDIVRNVRRMFERCATCGRPLGFGCCPTQVGGALHHGKCLCGTASQEPTP